MEKGGSSIDTACTTSRRDGIPSRGRSCRISAQLCLLILGEALIRSNKRDFQGNLFGDMFAGSLRATNIGSAATRLPNGRLSPLVHQGDKYA